MQTPCSQSQGAEKKRINNRTSKIDWNTETQAKYKRQRKLDSKNLLTKKENNNGVKKFS